MAELVCKGDRRQQRWLAADLPRGCPRLQHRGAVALPAGHRVAWP